MKRHPREQYVREARGELQKSLLKWLEFFDLTTAEEVMVLTTVMSGLITGTMKYAIREERHGDANVPGGVASD